MSITGIVLLVLLVIAAIYSVGVYNHLVNLKHGVGKAWANIDVLLKQRHDEIPKLVETCKRYMQHERDTLENVIKARAAVASASDARDMGALGAAEGALRRGLGRIFALAEAYPDLKASEQFSYLQSRISGLENAIADRRELYNESVNVNNVRIEQFPDALIAKLFSFQPFDLLKFASEEKRDVNVRELFNA